MTASEYVIVSNFIDPHDGLLCWSNEDGWGFFETATRFTQEEHEDSNLPMDARGWLKVVSGSDS